MEDTYNMNTRLQFYVFALELLHFSLRVQPYVYMS